MRSEPLSPSALRRLDDLCDAWAASYCNRWADRPRLATSSLHRRLNYGRQWSTTYEIEGEEAAQTAERLHLAVAALADDHRRALEAWAWGNHYNRGLIRKVERTESGTVCRVFKSNRTTPEKIDAAKLALSAVLGRFNVLIAD